jgi:IS5 family transposase
MLNIVTQITFADYGEIEILGDLERLLLAMLGMCDEALMQRLEARRGNGRDDYPVRVMWNLIIAMKVFGHRTVQSFRRELSRNSQLRKLCGLCDFARKKHLVPPARVFSNFMALLMEEQAELDDIFNAQVDELRAELPEFGENAAGGGKYLDSYANSAAKNPNPKAGNRAERDAAWSIKEYHYIDKNGKKQSKKEYHYGFKAHIICDVKTELPIAYFVTAANADEKKAMIILVEGLSDQMKLRMKHLMLDRGYDSTEMIQSVKSAGIIPIVDIRNCWQDGETTKQYKNTDIVYDYQGNVYFVDDKMKQHRMHYEGYDCQKKCLRYSHKGKVYKIYISYDERVFLPVARDSLKFARLYKGRTSVERLNGRLDRDYMFEDHCIRGLKKMNMMVSLTLIIMNAMALGKIRSGVTDHLAALTKLEIQRAA